MHKLFEKSINLIGKKQFDKALKVLLNLHKQNPKNLEIYLALEHTKMGLCDWKNLSNREKKIIKWIKAKISNKEKINFPLCYVWANISEKIFVQLNNLNQNIKKKLYPIGRKKNKEKIKIGYLSLDFRSHSAGISLLPLIKTHNKKKFDVFLYTYSSFKFLKDFNYKFRNIKKLNIQQIINTISRDNLDILIDTTANLLNSKSPVLNFNPAGLNLSSWGYGEICNQRSSFTIADKEIINRYSKIVKNLSFIKTKYYHPIPYKKINNKNISRNFFGLPKNSILIGNFNAAYKLHPNLFTSWINILKKIKNAKLVLMVENSVVKNNLVKTMKNKKLNPNKIIFVKKINYTKHLQRLSTLDLLLDNPRLGGGSTLSDGVSVGTPSLSYKSNLVASFSGGCILKSYNLKEYFSKSVKEYEKNVVRILKNKKILIEAKNKFFQVKKDLPKTWNRTVKDYNKILIKFSKMALC